MRNEFRESALVCRMHQFRSIQTLLALALLLEQVTSAIPAESQLTASGSANALLGAAVGLQFRHTVDGV